MKTENSYFDVDGVEILKMQKVNEGGGYAYYIGIEDKKKVYNIVPSSDPAPSGGYYLPETICEIKNVPNLF